MIAIFSTIFQLAGAIIVGYKLTFRKKEDSIKSEDIHGGFFKDDENLGFGEGKGFRGLQETWIYRFGFIYILIGYALPLFEINDQLKIKVIEKLFLVSICVIVLILIGKGISDLIAHCQSEK